MATATKATEEKTFGNKSVYRLTADSSVKTANAPDWAKCFTARNDDASNSIIINFDGDVTHYYTVKPGASLPNIPIIKGETLHYKAVSGTAKLEIIVWG